MNQAAAIIEAYPKPINNDRELLARCIEACIGCAQTCTACANACLSEDAVQQLVKCIRSDLDCADVCMTTGRVLSRHTGYDANVTRAVLQLCAQACRSCGDECDRHASKHAHCRICAETCRQCEQICQEVLDAL